MEGAQFSAHNDPDGASVKVLPLQGSADGRVLLPVGDDFLRADFSRSGPDLLIETPSGQAYVIPSYFTIETSPALMTHDGALLSAKLVTALAGPMAPAQMAQIAAPGSAAQQGFGLGEPIGQVSESAGQVSVTHADGVKATLEIGDNIYQGDVLETGEGSSVGVVFVDDTVFSLDEGGRMVMDEMVYDPGSQTGVFNAQVVQGVFSFVSGKVAKTSPEGMVINTPTNTIGIRGSTVLGKAAAEGTENTVTLMTDVDGNVGEIVISNAAGSQVLNVPGATVSVFSFNAPPPPPFIMAPQDIQKNFGSSLTKLTKVVAQKAKQDVARAEQKAQQSEDDARQAETEAKQTDDDARQAEDEAVQADAEASQAQLEAEAAQAEAEAAKAAALDNVDAQAQAKAQAAEAKAQAAIAKAAEVKAAAEAKAAEAAAQKAAAEAAAAQAAAKAAEAQVAQQQVLQAAQFSAIADTAFTQQTQAFDAFQQTQPSPDPTAPQPGAQGQAPASEAQQAATAATSSTANTASTPPPDNGDAAAKAAYEDAIAAGATPQDAFEAAALAASGGNMDDPAVALARAAFQEALASGASPQDAMLAAQSAVNQFDFQQQQFNPLQTSPMPGQFDPNTPFMGTYNPYFSGMPGDYAPYAGAYGPMTSGFMDIYMDPMFAGGVFVDPLMDPLGMYSVPNMIYDPLAFDPFFGYANVYFDAFAQDNLTVDFGETLIAPAAGGTMSGSGLNSNFYFHWGAINLGAHYYVTDQGGQDQISFDNLNTVTAKVVFGTDGTSGSITIYDDITASHQYATVTFSGIDQFLLSDVTVAGFSVTNFTNTTGGDVLVLPGMTGGQTGYVIAASDAASETINLNTAMNGAIVFAKGGADTINIDADINTGGLTVIGGVTSTDNVDSNADGIPDQYLNVFDYSATTTKSLYATMSAGDVTVSDSSTNGTFHQDLWDVASYKGSALSDTITINSGAYNTIDTFTGNDVVTVRGNVKFASIQTGAGDDQVIVYSDEYASLAVSSIADSAGTADKFVIAAKTGGTYDMSTYSTAYTTASGNGFDYAGFTGVSATSAINVTAISTMSYLDGSGHNDTLTGGAGNDIIIGQHGSDTLTGGGGADIFAYKNLVDGGTAAGGDTISGFSGATAFGGGGGDGDILEFSTATFGLGSVIYEEIAWGGGAGAITLANTAANVIVLTGGTAGSSQNALSALAAGNAAATNAIVVFNNSDNGNMGTVYHTADLGAGSSSVHVLATFDGQTGDLANLSNVDFSVV